MALETPVKAHKKWRKNRLLLPLHLYNPLWSQESVDLCISKKKRLPNRSPDPKMSTERLVHLTVFRPEMDSPGAGKNMNFLQESCKKRRAPHWQGFHMHLLRNLDWKVGETRD